MTRTYSCGKTEPNTYTHQNWHSHSLARIFGLCIWAEARINYFTKDSTKDYGFFRIKFIFQFKKKTKELMTVMFISNGITIVNIMWCVVLHSLPTATTPSSSYWRRAEHNFVSLFTMLFHLFVYDFIAIAVSGYGNPRLKCGNGLYLMYDYDDKRYPTTTRYKKYSGIKNHALT